MITDQGQRARMISYIESHAPARSRDLVAIGVAATAISRALGDLDKSRMQIRFAVW